MANGVLLSPGQGETITAREQRDVVIKVAHTLFDITWSRYAPGQRGPEPHIHRGHTDSFYVLDGEVTFTLGSDEREVRAGAGSYAVALPGVAHTFSNPSDETVRALNAMAPGGFEQYLKEAAAATGQGPPDPAVMAEIASRYDFEAVE